MSHGKVAAVMPESARFVLVSQGVTVPLNVPVLLPAESATLELLPSSFHQKVGDKFWSVASKVPSLWCIVRDAIWAFVSAVDCQMATSPIVASMLPLDGVAGQKLSLPPPMHQYPEKFCGAVAAVGAPTTAPSTKSVMFVPSHTRAA